MARTEQNMRAMLILALLAPFALAISGLIYLQAGIFARFSRTIATSFAPIPLSGVTRLAATLPPTVTPRPRPRPWQRPTLAPSADPLMQALGAAFSGNGRQTTPFPADKSTPLADSTQKQLLALTEAVRAGLSMQGASTSFPGTGQAPPDLAGLLVQALLQGQSLAYLDTRLNAAIRQGEVLVPVAFVTSEGRVDTSALLAAIIRSATTAEGDLRDDPGTAPGPVGIYTVRKGDSLGSIARVLYGDAARFDLIFDANRDTLASPDSIRVGQRLRIPPLDRQPRETR